jgi:hypothetical protein
MENKKKKKTIKINNDKNNNKNQKGSCNSRKNNNSSEMDLRFSQVLNDPRFKSMRRKEKKVQIDSRFKGMFTDKRFTSNSAVDKRGFTVTDDSIEKRHLKRVYDEEEDVKGDEEQKKVEKKVDEIRDKPVQGQGEESDIDDDSDEEDDSEELSSSSDESLSESEEAALRQQTDLDHNWAELDTNAIRSDATSSRLAVCNVDWDRLKATDIFVLVNSFKPENGSIDSVRVYVSRFGRERMAEEAVKGPKELSDIKRRQEESDDEEQQDEKLLRGVVHQNEDDEMDEFTREKLREYQLKRLKYFYAVVECDSAETAEILYKELDGLEYESSASSFDVRFIPDSESFEEEELRDECLAMPDMTSYERPVFISSALQQTKVQLTWDETDPERRHKINKAFTSKDEKAMNDLEAFLASNSESEDDGEDDSDDEVETLETKPATVQEKMNKYKRLLLQQEQEEEKEEQEGEDLEIEFDEDGNVANLGDGTDDHDQESRGDDVEEDPEEDDEEAASQMKKSKRRRLGNAPDKKERKKMKPQRQEEETPSSKELGLLVMDEEQQEKSHFNYNDIVKNEASPSKSRRKKLKKMLKDKKNALQDNFRFDSSDPRFSSVYSRPDFNIDPSDPHFKRTPAMMDIMTKKVSSKKLGVNRETAETTTQSKITETKKTNSSLDPALSRLITCVKNRSKDIVVPSLKNERE